MNNTFSFGQIMGVFDVISNMLNGFLNLLWRALCTYNSCNWQSL